MNGAKLLQRALLVTGLGVLRIHQVAYELTDGRVGAQVGHLSMLLLRTRGRRSGRIRTSALLFGRDGDRLVIVGSRGGDDRPPGWLVNLEEEPEAEVQIGRQRRPVRARVARGAERTRLWGLMNRYWDYEAYQARTRRRIPVVVLEPR